MLGRALVLVVCAASTSSAAPYGDCDCPGTTVLPAVGTFGVAQNTRTWRIDGFAVTWKDHGVLAADTEHSLDGTQFVTGPFVDTQAPDAPENMHAYIELAGRSVEHVRVDGRIDNEAAVVEIAIIDGSRETTLYTTPSRLAPCHPGITLEHDLVQVRVRAFDLAGNASAPTSQVVHAADLYPNYGTPCGERQHHFGSRSGALEGLLAIAGGVVLGLIALFCVRVYRKHAIEHAPPTPISHLAAEAIVRASTLRYTAITIAAVAGAWFATPVAIVALWSFVLLIKRRIARHRLDQEHVLVERRASWIVITTVHAQSHVYASERTVTRAEQRALPVSTIAR